MQLFPPTICSVFSLQKKTAQQDEEIAGWQLAFLLQPGEVILRVQTQAAAQSQ